MLLDRLQSGFLLFETPQGLARAELSPGQRIYLLWTFRNFRRLSIPLLNSRQRTLVNGLFRNHVGVAPHGFNPALAIGVVEKFVPTFVPTMEPVDASPRPKPALQAAPQTASPPAWKDERLERVVAPPTEIASQSNFVIPSSPRFVWPTFAWFKRLRSGLATFRLAMSKLAVTQLATTIGVLGLGIISVAAWHRMQAVPYSQARNRAQFLRIKAMAVQEPPRSAALAASVGNAVTVAAPAAQVPLAAVSDATVTRASIAAGVPVHRPVDTPVETPGHSTASISAPMAASSSTPKRAMRVPETASTRLLSDPLSDHPLSDHRLSDHRLSDPGSGISGIQASRPPLHFAYPDYRDVRARGVVSLTAGVDSDGFVRTVRVISGNRALAAAAVRAIRQWRYRPYLKDGQAIATETNIVISFFSDDAISMSFPPSIPGRR